MGAPENDPSYPIQRLNKKINDDQVEMAKMQSDCEKMQAALERKKASEQLAAWAIDRAIETLKNSAPTPASVIDTAKQYCDWIMSLRENEDAPAQETLQ